MHTSTNHAKYLNWPGDTYIRAVNVDLLICTFPEFCNVCVCAFLFFFLSLSPNEFDLFQALMQSIPFAAHN